MIDKVKEVIKNKNAATQVIRDKTVAAPLAPKAAIDRNYDMNYD